MWRSPPRRSGGAGTSLEKEKPVSTTWSSKYIFLPFASIELPSLPPICTGKDLRSPYRHPRFIHIREAHSVTHPCPAEPEGAGGLAPALAIHPMLTLCG